MLQNLFNKPLFDPSFLNLDYFFNKILQFFQSFGSWHFGATIYLISYVLSLFGITIIIYSIVRLIEIQKDETAHLKHEIASIIERKHDLEVGTRNTRWDHIQELVSSVNPSDWRLAIIEADTILDSLLQTRGIAGASVSDNLKASPLKSNDAAWQAHIVRNRIAHEGSNFELSQREARRAISLFEVVFHELGFL